MANNEVFFGVSVSRSRQREHRVGLPKVSQTNFHNTQMAFWRCRILVSQFFFFSAQRLPGKTKTKNHFSTTAIRNGKNCRSWRVWESSDLFAFSSSPSLPHDSSKTSQDPSLPPSSPRLQRLTDSGARSFHLQNTKRQDSWRRSEFEAAKPFRG